jgi:hypothetical protein
MSQPLPLVAAARAPRLAEFGLRADRPLVLVDVDEVLGLFVQGFGRFLEMRGLELRLQRFALFESIFEPGEAAHLAVEHGRRHLEEFFRYGAGDIGVAPGAPEALAEIARDASVVILTNAPGQARLARARWLGRHGLDYPLVLNAGPKGPMAAALSAQVEAPAAFIDDLLPNLDSVAEAAPQVARFQMVADPALRPIAPTAPERHRRIDHWPELAQAVKAAVG